MAATHAHALCSAIRNADQRDGVRMAVAATCARLARGRGRATPCRNAAQSWVTHAHVLRGAMHNARARGDLRCANWLLPMRPWDGFASYAPHALQNAALLCTKQQIGVLRRTRDAAMLDAGEYSCDVLFCLPDSHMPWW